MADSRRLLDIHTRVNEHEYALIRSLFDGPLTSETLRVYLIAQATTGPSLTALMAEVLALRTIVLSTLATLAPASAPALQAAADRDKMEKAGRRLEGVA